jgi:hypothetical protein
MQVEEPQDVKPLKDKHNYHIIKIYRRSKLEWTTWIIWVLINVFLLQNAKASVEEYHPRAGIIFAALFFLVLLAGFIAYFLRRENRLNREKEEELTNRIE